MSEYVIRTMAREELDWAVEMAAKEGWNPGLSDSEAFYAQDPDGFLIGLLNETPIGCISAVSYNGRFGFIGFYIVDEAHRHNGYGIQLWKAAMERLKGQGIGLDGVFDQQENYSKSGFVFQYSNIRFEYRNTLAGKDPVAASAQNPRTLGKADVAEVAEYERKMFPEPREAFLDKWLAMPQSHALGLYAGEQLSGYGVIRPCRKGYKIGPLFADSPQQAQTLFVALCSLVENDAHVYIDVPEIHEAAMAMAEQYQIQQVFGTARMYSGTPPLLDLHRIFGVTTFELG